MKNRKLITIMGVVSSYFSFVVFSFAQDSSVDNITGTLNQIVIAIEFVIIPTAITIAFAYFFYNGVKFLASGGESDGSSNKTQLILSVIGLFVLVSIWGILYFFIQVTGVGDIDSQSVPKFEAGSKLYDKATKAPE